MFFKNVEDYMNFNNMELDSDIIEAWNRRQEKLFKYYLYFSLTSLLYNFSFSNNLFIYLNSIYIKFIQLIIL